MKSGTTSKNKRKKITRRRVFIPGPDRRNVARGVEWLRKMIEASEQKECMDKVVDEMVPAGKQRDDLK